MENESINLTRWQHDRRAFIEHRVFWHGRVGLADLTTVMGLSRAQASKDLNSYINYHPGHIVYDKTAKTYVLGPKFKARYVALDPSEYLGDLLSISRGASVPAADWVVYQPDILGTAVPGRGLSPLTVRNVLLACEQGKTLSIDYQSMSSSDPIQRQIAPHALAHDGFRWHARALCFKDQTFKTLPSAGSRIANLMKTQILTRKPIGIGKKWTCHAKVPVSQLMLGSLSLESQGTFPAKG